MTDPDREIRILELRHLVEKGEYQIDSLQVAACIIRQAGPVGLAKFPLSSKRVEHGLAVSKTANSAD